MLSAEQRRRRPGSNHWLCRKRVFRFFLTYNKYICERGSFQWSCRLTICQPNSPPLPKRLRTRWPQLSNIRYISAIILQCVDILHAPAPRPLLCIFLHAPALDDRVHARSSQPASRPPSLTLIRLLARLPTTGFLFVSLCLGFNSFPSSFYISCSHPNDHSFLTYRIVRH
jgi:hypothetical protein